MEQKQKNLEVITMMMNYKIQMYQKMQEDQEGKK